MRILNRPMFRSGGPIREGIMHGMKNGGRTGFKDGTEFKNPYKVNSGYNWFETPVGKLVDPRGLPRQALLGGKKMIAGTYDLGAVPINKAVEWASGYNPGFSGAKFMRIKPDKPDTAYWMGIPTKTKKGWTIPSMEHLNPKDAVVKEKIIKEKWDPGAGREDYVDPNLAKKLAADNQKERYNNYLKMMGYDRSKKLAGAQALIDTSRDVQEATTEAGSLKEADWGNLINRMIQTTSKTYDKPEQIREAVGLMMTKAEIQKDMNKAANERDAEVQDLQIQKLRKDLKGNSYRENLIVAEKALDGEEAIRMGVQLTEGTNLKGSLQTKSKWKKALKKMKEDPTSTGLNDKQLVVKFTEELIKDKNYQDGDYTVGDNLITIKDSQVIDVR
jgi:hypothetical protein